MTQTFKLTADEVKQIYAAGERSGHQATYPCPSSEFYDYFEELVWEMSDIINKDTRMSNDDWVKSNEIKKRLGIKG